MIHNQEENQTIGTDSKIIEMTELSEKDIKIIGIAIIFKFERERKTWTWGREKMKDFFKDPNDTSRDDKYTWERKEKNINILKETCYGATSTKMLAPHINPWGCYVDCCYQGSLINNITSFFVTELFPKLS